MGLRHSQARWRLRAWLSSDPAVSPKRQLNQSCSAAHILNPDLVRINNGMDLLVSSLATHCTFHGTDTILRKMLHSDLMKFKPRAPPRKDKEKAKTDQSFARSSSFPLPQSHKIWNNFSGLQRWGDSQPEQTEQRTKHLALRSDFPFIPESGSHLGGKGKILEPDLLLWKNHLLERSLHGRKRVEWTGEGVRKQKEGRLKEIKEIRFISWIAKFIPHQWG